LSHLNEKKKLGGHFDRAVSFMAMLTAMVLWGSSFVAMKISFLELEPLLVILGRLVVASLCFLPFIGSFRKVPVKKHHIVPMLLMAFCEPCLYFIFEAAALQRTSASQASMITTMLPLLVALAAGFLLKEKVSFRTITGFFIAAAGAVWLTMSGVASEHAPNPVLGNFLEFMAMVCATGYIILMKYLSKDLPPLFLTAVQCFVGALFFMPVLCMPQGSMPETVPVTALLVVVYLGIFVTIGAYGLYNFGVSRMPASQASALLI
jgi:drug/metabolite transporter (DMT)-like permease